MLQHQTHQEEFLQHLNTVDPSIQFTVEEAKEDGSIPFLDTIIRPESDGTFTIGVYRKPTHTDLYLPWDSNHNIAAKYSVINTFTHRAHTICSTPELAEKELQHLEQVLGLCKYPKWAIWKIFNKHQCKEKKQTPRNKHHTKCHIVVPYIEGIGKSLKKICKKHGVDMHFKGGRTLKNILVSPKDQDKITNKNSIIYSYSCGSIDCGEEYIGESGRTFGERFKEHLKAPSPIFQHQNIQWPYNIHRKFQNNRKRRQQVWPEQSKNQCISEWTILHSIGILESTIFHTSGTIYYSASQNWRWNNCRLAQ